jgi:hypothetical protein
MPDSTLRTPSAAPDDGIVVDEHFAALVPRLTPAEHVSLEKRLLTSRTKLHVAFDVPLNGEAVAQRLLDRMGKAMGRGRAQAVLVRGREMTADSLRMGNSSVENHADESAR